MNELNTYIYIAPIRQSPQGRYSSRKDDFWVLYENALVSINEVPLRPARLVVGWVTVCRRYVISQPDQLTLAIHLH